MSARQITRDASMRVERKARAGAAVLLAVVIAIAGAWALVHYATPCTGGTLC